MATKSIGGIVEVLKEIVDENSPKYLEDEPYQVYEKLLESGAVDRKTAAALLHLLAGGLLETTDPGYDAELLSDSIRKECSINKQMADRLATILYILYSQENKREWSRKEKKGLSQFLKEEFICDWRGFAVWDAGNGTVDCRFEARIIFRPIERISEDKELVKLLAKNSFTTKETICDLFTKRLQEYLDNVFEYYCTEDDYYQPVVEDFGSNLEYDLKQWGEENGFEYISFEGNGDDGGYEPKFSKGWY